MNAISFNFSNRRSNSFRQANDKGFTLIEIMIAVLILAGLSLLTSQAIQSSMESRKKLNRQIAEDSLLRDALHVIERDINLAYHHRDTETTMWNAIVQEQQKKSSHQNNNSSGNNPNNPNDPNDPNNPPKNPDDPNNPNNPQAPSTDPSTNTGQNPNDSAGNEILQERTPPKELTSFQGSSNELHFTTLANVRTQRDILESEQAEVGFFLRNCKSRISQSLKSGGRQGDASSSNCLFRRLSPYIDEDVTKGGNDVVILENIEEMSFRYFGPERDDWVSEWKTGANGDAISKENFPYAVEVTLKVEDKNDAEARKLAVSKVIPLHFPNNADKAQLNPESYGEPAPVSPPSSGPQGTGTGAGSVQQ